MIITKEPTHHYVTTINTAPIIGVCNSILFKKKAYLTQR
jgi:hypothetical protein